MGLQGMTLATWAGWFTGLVFLERPWGRPSFPSWLSFSTLIVTLYTTIRIFVSIDSVYNFYDIYLQPLYSKQGALLTLINHCAFWEQFISSPLTQIIFLKQAKKFGLLWDQLYQRNLEDGKKAKVFFGDFFQIIVSITSMASLLVCTTLNAIPAGQNVQRSWLSAIGQVPYSITIASFVAGPLVLPSYCALTAVIATLYHLECVYERYCRMIHDLMLRSLFENVEMKGKEEEVAIRKLKENAEDSNDKNIMMIGLKNMMGKEEKVKLVQEFEEIQSLFMLSESTISPLMFVMLTGAAFRLIMYVGRVVIRHRETTVDTVFVIDCCQIIHLGCQMYILQVGQRIKDKFAAWNTKLRKLTVELATVYTTEAQDLKDLCLMIENWKWRLTACRYFDVDKQLVIGIFQLLMTYTVVLVQIRIAVDGDMFI
ncbi:unnamed protein product [Orchesella dallaii]|uniref:Gustatory receptor n=1 Tax=Orchesella dallaii TaxID=48710 RepID=A0ABP1Q708_9HEXA